MFFFFKQKTAYEMRISDWSSDVCSSDLPIEVERRGDHAFLFAVQFGEHVAALVGDEAGAVEGLAAFDADAVRRHDRHHVRHRVPHHRAPPQPCGIEPLVVRSEEHTSELQSLMRISYAVFCLKKKNTNSTQQL